MKKHLLLFFIMALLPMIANAYDAQINGIYYNFSGDKATVTYFSSSYDSNKDAYTGSVIIPESVSYNGSTYSVTSIGDYAFRNCGGINSVSIPLSVTSIGYDSFQNCSGISSLAIPSSVVEISNSAFYGCKNITTITLSSNLKTIGDYVFYGCSSITSITLPNNLNTIGRYAFCDCSSITSITLPSSLKTIGDYAFGNCSSLVEVNSLSPTPPSANKYYMVFYGCANPFLIVPDNALQSYKNAEPWKDFKDLFEISKRPLSYGQFFYQVNYDGESATIVGFKYGLPPESVTIPDYIGEQELKVTSLGTKLFYMNNTLKHLYLGKNISSITFYALYCPYALEDVVVSVDNQYYTSRDGVLFSKNMKKLMLYPPGKKDIVKYVIPYGVTSIDECSQFYHSQLSEVVIPSTVNHIQTLAFAYSANLKVVHCQNTELPFIGSSIFLETKAREGTLYVPKGCRDKYRSDPEWAVFKTIIEEENQQPEAYAVLSTDKTTLTFYYDSQKDSRQGTIYTADQFRTGTYNGWGSSRSTITTVTFDVSFTDYNGLTSTNNWFEGCSSLHTINGLAYLNTSNVKNMSSMFRGCYSLTSLDVSNFNTSNVTDMNSMFYQCRSLKSLDVSNFNTSNVTDMGSTFQGWNGMFAYCSGLTNLDLSNFNTANVTSMRGMFLGCSSLINLDVSKFNTEKVRDMTEMFKDCSSLPSLNLTSWNTQNVKYMGYYWEEINENDGSLMTADAGMFFGCSSLITIYVSEGWTTENVSLEDSFMMFDGCTSLVGADGTKYDPHYTDKTKAYAGPGGYLTMYYADDLQDYLNSLVDTGDTMAGNSYRREFKNTDWQSLYLPFDMNYEDWATNFEVARFNGVEIISNDNGEDAHAVLSATIMESGKINANTPYLIRAKAEGITILFVDYSGANYSVRSVSYRTGDATYTFTGNYEDRTGMCSAQQYRMLGGWLALPTSDTEVLPPYRWYMTVEGTLPTEAIRGLKVRIASDDDATAITEMMNSKSSDNSCFDIQGRKVNESQMRKGIYIINNKKYIIN